MNAICRVSMACRSDECDLTVQTDISVQNIRYVSDLGALFPNGLHLEKYLCCSDCYEKNKKKVIKGALACSLNVALNHIHTGFT